jgi:hypothetical protein
MKFSAAETVSFRLGCNREPAGGDAGQFDWTALRGPPIVPKRKCAGGFGGDMDQGDLVIVNARVLAMDPARPRAACVALRGARILDLGGKDEVLARAAPGARILDARGASVLPGFVESHLHLFAGAAELTQLQLLGVSGAEALARAIRSYAEAHPELPAIVGQGCDCTPSGGA